MKKGANACIYPRSFSTTDILQTSAKLGFEGVELNVDEDVFSPARLSVEDRRQVTETAASLGLELPSLCGGLFWKYNLAGPDEALRRKGIEIGKECCRLASDLGAKVVLVVPAVATPDLSYETVWTLAKSSVREIGSAAAEFGVTVGVENVWNRFLYSPVEFRDFLQEVNHESVKAYFDVGNVLFLGFPQQWIRALSRDIACVHVKDFDLEKREFRSLLQGDVPWADVTSALTAVGYDGYLNVEVGPDRGDPTKAASENRLALTRILEMVPSGTVGG